MGPARHLAALGVAVAILAWGAPPALAHERAPERLTAQFAAMNGAGWTGGDAAWSARLPDGREVWLFGDTFVGGVDEHGGREPNSSMARNSMVVGADTLPGPSGSGENDWYWPGPPVVGHGTLQVPMAHIARTGPGGWDFEVIGTSLAVFGLPHLELRRLTPIATPPGVNMASATVDTRRFTYIYGTRGAMNKATFVARAPRGELEQPWSYWTGSSWSADPSAAAPVAEGVSDEFSVLRRGRSWIMISQVPCSRSIVAFRADKPQGNWRSMGEIASIPSIPHAMTYNAIVHPEFSHGRTLVIGYSVNGESEAWVYADAALYRPRFMTVRI